MRVDAVELTPRTLRAVLPNREDDDEEEEEEEEEGEEVGRAQLAEMPEGLRGLAGGLRELTVQSMLLAEVPAWVGDFTRLEALSLSGRFRDSVVSEGNEVLTALPAVFGQLGALKRLKISHLDGLQEMPPLGGLTRLESLTIDLLCLRALPAGLGQLGALKQLAIASLHDLEEIPDTLGGLTLLEVLTIDECHKLRVLPAGLFRLGVLKEMQLTRLPELQEMPDPSGLTSLEALEIDGYNENGSEGNTALRALPAGLGQLGALKKLRLSRLKALQEIPDTLGRLTSLEDLMMAECHKLKALPASIMHLSRLQHLEIYLCPIQDMPCIDALTALRTLKLVARDYAHGSRVFKALSRSLPCLQQLGTLQLSGVAEPDQDGDRYPVDLRAEDVLAIGRALRAWPLPLLRLSPFIYSPGMTQVLYGIPLSTCWQALGLPAAAADWSNATTLGYFRVQQHKVAAFASGMHARLGAASGVSGLDEQMLVMIADEVLGGWGLLREWRRQEGVGEGAGAQ